MHALTVVSNSLATDSVWSKSGSPYLISGNITIPKGITLTINPGVVVKPIPDSGIEVRGSLITNGDANEPIVFTSVKDKEYGGDTSDYISGFSATSSKPVILSTNNNGSLRLSLSDGSSMKYITWASDFSGGINGSDYTDESFFDFFNPKIPFGSNIQVIITDVKIDNGCSTPIYNDDIRGDLECPIFYAEGHHIPMKIYRSSPPAERDWNMTLLFSGGSKGVLSHVIMKYGGGSTGCATRGCTSQPIIQASRGSVSISNSTISDVKIPISADDFGSINITNSLFLNVVKAIIPSGSFVTVRHSAFVNTEVGIETAFPYYNKTDYDFKENWWGDVRGPKTTRENECGGAWSDRRSVFSPWLVLKPDVGATSTAIFPTNFATSSERATIPVLVIPGILGSLEFNGSWIMDPIFHVYDNLMNTFLNNGYSASSTLFTFPYDWRKSNIETAELLGQRIQVIKKATNCSYVDIIAHSMGGLVAQSYVTSESPGNVHSLIFLGVPNRGAPEDYLVWESGSINTSIAQRFLSFILGVYARAGGYSNSLDYIKNYPVSSIRELLPIYSYLQNVSASSTASSTEIMNFPNGYPQNDFLQSLRSKFSRNLSFIRFFVQKIMSVIGNIPTSTVTMINIKKPPSEASSTLPLEWPDGRAIAIQYGMGDGTVPFSSATMASDFIDETIVSANHKDIPTVAGDFVFKAITGKNPTNSFHRSAARNILSAAINYIADILITSPSGKRVGKDFHTGESIIEIPDSFYSGPQSSPQIVSIPDPEVGSYTVEAKGKASGQYQIHLEEMSEATSTSLSRDFVGETATGTITRIIIDTGTTSNETTSNETILPTPTQVAKIDGTSVQNSETTRRRSVSGKNRSTNIASIQKDIQKNDVVILFEPHYPDSAPEISEAKLSFDPFDVPAAPNQHKGLLALLVNRLKQIFGMLE